MDVERISMQSVARVSCGFGIACTRRRQAESAKCDRIERRARSVVLSKRHPAGASECPNGPAPAAAFGGATNICQPALPVFIACPSVTVIGARDPEFAEQNARSRYSIPGSPIGDAREGRVDRGPVEPGREIRRQRLLAGGKRSGFFLWVEIGLRNS